MFKHRLLKTLNLFKKYFKSKPLKILASILIVLLSLLAGFMIFYANRYYPNTHIVNIDVSNLTENAAYLKIENELVFPIQIVLYTAETKYEIETTDIGIVYDLHQTVTNSFDTSHSINLLLPRLFSGWFFTDKKFDVSYHIDDQKFKDYLSVISGAVSIEPIYPSVNVVNGNTIIDKGKNGTQLVQSVLSHKINDVLKHLESKPIEIPIEEINSALSEEDYKVYKNLVELLSTKKLNLTYEDKIFTYTQGDIAKLADPKGKGSQIQITNLIEKVLPEIETEPQNPTFIFSEGKVAEFAPSKEGIKINTESLSQLITVILTELINTDQTEKTIVIPVTKTPPKITTDQVNNLGIKELLGRGTSNFKGSITSRVHNVALAASKLNGILVAPGETFSFNKSLGDVSAYTGYKQAYVIQDGKTILGDGGGVCQVSTTLFRATLAAGLPITERRAHSYRVYYYEQGTPPGIDATVFSPTTDFKFTNDTPAHILIQTKTDTKNLSLVFELYGTADGRIATSTKPIITSSTPPPEDLYTDDPTLPAGQVKQIEHSAWGARVVFDYKVVKAGAEIYTKTFVSNYRPWQAVYLKGTGM